MARRRPPDRKRQRETLRALDAARRELERAPAPADPELRAAYDAAVAAYWSCHQVRNSKRAGIRVTEG